MLPQRPRLARIYLEAVLIRLVTETLTDVANFLKNGDARPQSSASWVTVAVGTGHVYSRRALIHS